MWRTNTQPATQPRCRSIYRAYYVAQVKKIRAPWWDSLWGISVLEKSSRKMTQETFIKYSRLSQHLGQDPTVNANELYCTRRMASGKWIRHFSTQCVSVSNPFALAPCSSFIIPRRRHISWVPQVDRRKWIKLHTNITCLFSVARKKVTKCQRCQQFRDLSLFLNKMLREAVQHFILN